MVYTIFIKSRLLSVSKWIRTARTKQSREDSPIPASDHFFLRILLITISAPKYPRP